jgi:toxin ParE1/3/4
VRRLEWRQPARDDLAAILDHITAHNQLAAMALLDDIERRIAQLATRPNLYRPGRVEGTREMVVRPSYIVVYAVSPAAVTILRVLHTARAWP